MQTLKHYIKRIQELGFKGSVDRLTNRFKQSTTALYYKQKVRYRLAAHSWKSIAKNHKLSSDFSIFLSQLKTHTYIKDMYKHPEFQASMPAYALCDFRLRTELRRDKPARLSRCSFSEGGPLTSPESISTLCEQLHQKKISILGAHLEFNDHNQIPWQYDFRSISLHKNNALSDAWLQKNHKDLPNWMTEKNLFYKDISISYPQTIDESEYAADIKIPWDFSRMQHLVPLYFAYEGDSAFAKATARQPMLDGLPSRSPEGRRLDEKHATFFYNHIQSWLDNNPVMLGATWVCPMDVGIRAANLIWGFHFFKDSPSISPVFWEQLTCSLYDHALYLERNWELSDKPSNHYLADLVGYFYLCTFFKDIPYFQKQGEWCKAEIIKQSEIQLATDGTDYEGSTSYHGLVTEMFFHFYMLCLVNKVELPDTFAKKLDKAFEFIDDCTDSSGNLVRIGDNDSGVFLGGINMRCRPYGSTALKHYPNFGLTIIKDPKWHITYRHPTFDPWQPSGHFHQDQLSITVSLDGIPILIDPGSGVYTSNATMRNQFRAISAHNTFYAHPQPSLGDLLFQLPRQTQIDTAQIDQKNSSLSITNYYEHDEVKMIRTLVFDEVKSMVSIEDSIDRIGLPGVAESVAWNFLFHPDIIVKKENSLNWFISYQDHKVARFSTPHPFEQVTGHYSPAYGFIVPCMQLRNSSPIISDKAVFTLSSLND